MKSIHVLVAEDDTHLRNGLIDLLESEGYSVTAASNGEEAMKLCSKNRFHLLILDVMMPLKSGFDVCKAIRYDDQDIPIIMLTAKGEEIDKVVGLQLGADDYVTKPFGVSELLARIGAVLRRSKRTGWSADQSMNRAENGRTSRQGNESSLEDIPGHFSFGPAEIDARELRGRLGNRTFELSARELKLLYFFLIHSKQVLTRDQILNAVWGLGYFGTTRTLDQHIAQLRKKIEPNPKSPQVITTVHSIGYRYEGAQ